VKPKYIQALAVVAFVLSLVSLGLNYAKKCKPCEEPVKSEAVVEKPVDKPVEKPAEPAK
jgi:hypothetical protein